MLDHSQVQFLEISSNSEGQRLDNFLLRELKGLPKSRIYRLIRKGEIRLNRKRCKPDSRLSPGDQVRLPPLRLSAPAKLPVPGAGLSSLLLESVLHEDEDILIINKPAGLPVHGGSGVPLGLIEALRQLQPQWRELALAHRLDRDTSGCMVIAKKPTALREINQQLKLKTIKKTYLALVHGFWPDSLVEVEQPLMKNHLQSGERMVRVEQDGKPSLTRYQVVEHFGTVATAVQAMPVTGRTHQIRVHCQWAGHAIAGDPKYTDTSQRRSLPEITRLCLHASRLEFPIDSLLAGRAFEAPLSDYLEQQFKLLRTK